jgi:hypothetical protein
VPLAATPQQCLVYLGKALKAKRAQSEQFCVFAFDCMDRDVNSLWPEPAEIDRDELPFGESGPSDARWTAAFYNDVRPSHTEKSVLDVASHWASVYEGTYGRPTSLFIYSFLVPCLRDGKHGHCADNVFAYALWAKRHYGLQELYVGWSNEDRDTDLAAAIKTSLADLYDEGICVWLGQVSIAQ